MKPCGFQSDQWHDILKLLTIKPFNDNKFYMRCLRTKILLSICFWIFAFSTVAAKGPVTLNADILPGKWKAIRLKNLPKDAVVAVAVESSGDIAVALLDKSNYKRFPSPPRPLFYGKVENRLSFSVSIPAKGDYFVVFDNRSGAHERSVTVTIRAARGKGDQMEAANQILKEFEQQLHKIFIFEPFPIGIMQCGMPRAFMDESGVVLCAEYLHHLYDTLEDPEKTKEALSFSIFHELGRVLLTKWNHPASGEKEMADELAAVLMVMLNQKERAMGAAEFFVKNPSASEALMKLFRDDRHPLSANRAKEILSWLKDLELAHKWQKILVPHMQTSLLEKLRQQPTSWTDPSLVEKELTKRLKTSI